MTAQAALSTEAVAQQLVDLCRKMDFETAMRTLYAPEIVSVEAAASPDFPQELSGIDAVTRKAQWWSENHEVHAITVSDPLVAGPMFTVKMTLDATFKPIGQRIPMEEIAVYEVRNGKIVREQFFYDTQNLG